VGVAKPDASHDRPRSSATVDPSKTPATTATAQPPAGGDVSYCVAADNSGVIYSGDVADSESGCRPGDVSQRGPGF
jgi:hypothetical protein